MCTVTLLPLSNASTPRGPINLRLVCNRDELRTRPAALAPERRKCGGRWAIMPIDPVSGGTWIAVNDAGVIATLLNVYPFGPSGRPSSDLRSRGTIIPELMSCSEFEQIRVKMSELSPREFPSFRLIAVRENRLLECTGDGESIRISPTSVFDTPTMFTSSGLGDALVEGPRRDLFRSIFDGPDDPIAKQDRFHMHSWADRRHISVLMNRAEARTVSRTIVEVGSEHVASGYLPLAEDGSAQSDITWHTIMQEIA